MENIFEIRFSDLSASKPVWIPLVNQAFEACDVICPAQVTGSKYVQFLLMSTREEAKPFLAVHAVDVK